MKDAKGHGSNSRGSGGISDQEAAATLSQGHPKSSTAPAAQLMSEGQLSQLREGYGRINTIDPSGPSYPKLIALLDGSSQERLKQLAGANIKFRQQARGEPDQGEVT